MGFIWCCLSTDISTVRPLPMAEAIISEKMPVFSRVPPLSFLTTSTVYSALRSASLLHLAAGHRVRSVSRLCAEARRPFPERNTLRSVSLLSSLPSSPGLPLFTSVRSLSPLRSLLSRHCTLPYGGVSGVSPRPQGFTPLKSPLRNSDVAIDVPPDAPMGLLSDIALVSKESVTQPHRAASCSVEWLPGFGA
jgi:hypothetical protein